MSVLTCPKCHGQMRQYERNGVYVDQCSDCRGVFLDRGELERLIEAEARWSVGAPDRRPGRDGGRYDEDAHPRKRKKSFLEGLFDD